jgi:hypothetical protein
MELSDVNGSLGINYLIMHQETHSHVIGESAPSVYDINAEQLIRDRLSDARRFIDPEFNIIRGAIYYFR